ncbi:MAG: hypothetical protein P4L67_02645 [Candidatus Pacebacteria bacterium]|nr:hypothetical protein [Candidatus Paceibacterota bacterium]
MADKAQIEDLIKKKLAELEIANPTLSEEEAKKQKAELKAELKGAKDIMNDSAKSVADKIKLLYDFVSAAVPALFVNLLYRPTRTAKTRSSFARLTRS